MIYGSVCSGIEAATVAWEPLGWQASFVSEIAPFPRAVLEHRFPKIPLHGDFTTIEDQQYAAIDLLVGGTPCQSFSVAGLRQGLVDDRGNLALEFLRLADRLRARWLVWENVPGVLSSNEGRDFGAILGGMVELGYGVAYRTLDAQYVRTRQFFEAVPQRRRRVFVVGYLGDWRRAAGVLFDPESLRGNPAPRRRTGEAGACGAFRGADRGVDASHALANQLVPEVANPLTARMHKGVNTSMDEGQTMIAFGAHDSGEDALRDVSLPLRAGSHNASRANGGVPPAVAYDLRGRDGGTVPEGPHDTANIRAASGGSSRSVVQSGWTVRRLTPVECERLQGFPDGFTDVPWRGKKHSPKSLRWSALGNSMAVNVMQYIGERIALMDAV